MAPKGTCRWHPFFFTQYSITNNPSPNTPGKNMEGSGKPPIPISFFPPESRGAYLQCIAYLRGVV